LGVLDELRTDASPQDRKVRDEQTSQHHAIPSEQAPSLPRPVPGTSNADEPGEQTVRPALPASSPGFEEDDAPTVPLAAIPASATGVIDEDAPASREETPSQRKSVGVGPVKTPVGPAKFPTRRPGPARSKTLGGRHRRIIRGVVLVVALLSAGSLVF